MALSDPDFVPHVHVEPPRLTYAMQVHLDMGSGRYRAYSALTDDPMGWLKRWNEDWLEVAADLWGYEPPGITALPRRGDLLATLGLRKPLEPIRRRV